MSRLHSLSLSHFLTLDGMVDCVCTEKGIWHKHELQSLGTSTDSHHYRPLSHRIELCDWQQTHCRRQLRSIWWIIFFAYSSNLVLHHDCIMYVQLTILNVIYVYSVLSVLVVRDVVVWHFSPIPKHTHIERFPLYKRIKNTKSKAKVNHNKRTGFFDRCSGRRCINTIYLHHSRGSIIYKLSEEKNHVENISEKDDFFFKKRRIF